MSIKKIIFRFFLFLIPLCILFLIELILRLISYDGDTNIVATIERNGKMFYTINQLVGKRYFDKNRLYYRKGSHDYFEIKKAPNTIRIFCFGASTTAGFPYEYNAIPSEFLRERLAAAYLDKNIEVINTAIAATNSFTVVEFEKELVKYHPDLFIIYMGQNEFYGVYGIASTISLGKSRWLIKTNLWLQNFRIYLLLKNIINSVTGLIKTTKSDDNSTLMEGMVKNGTIRYNSRDYQISKETFRRNYEEAILIAKDNNIPVIISTIVTNEKNLYPFVSLYSENIIGAKRNECKDLYNSGLESEKEKDYSTAIKYFQNSLALDSLPANIHFELGNSYLGLGDFTNAKKQFIYANDFDGLRFRAPSEYNTIIRKLANKYGVPIANVAELFRKNSPNGILGNELLVDHVHPNIRGYFLLAKSWFDTIQGHKIFGTPCKNFVDDDSTFWQELPVTYLDSCIGEFKIKFLKSKPPYQNTENSSNILPKNYIEQQAYDLTIKHKITWGEAHLKVAEEYLIKKNYYDALKEIKAILLIDEENPSIQAMAANVYFNLGNYKDSETSYLKANSLLHNIFLTYRLGLVELNLNKLSTAIVLLRSCINNRDYSESLTPEDLIEARFNLALAHYKNNEKEKSLNELQILLKSYPNNQKAKELLRKIK